MQSSPQEYDFGKRAEYQCGRLLSTYLNKGEQWNNVCKVYQISVLNYGYKPYPIKDDAGKEIEEPDREDLVLSHYTMKNQYGERLTNILNIVFIDLTKLGRTSEYTVEKLNQISQAEKWALFLKNADKTSKNKVELIENLVKTEAGLMNAQTVLSSISENRALWLSQYHAEVRERDMISNLETAEKRGEERGEEKGFKKGINDLANLLRSGLSLEEALEKLSQE